MFARIEVGVRPDFSDPSGQGFLRRLELAHPLLRKKTRWARALDVYWIDVPVGREELISLLYEVFWDPALQWMFTGNLIPSATGKHGTLLDLMEHAPNRPGMFWAIERKFRPGVTDHCSRTVHEAFEIVSHRKLPEFRCATGGLLLLEGPELDEDSLAVIARDLFCNDLVETWTLLNEGDLKRNDRFHQERVKTDFPRVSLKASNQVGIHDLSGLAGEELEALSRKQGWALSRDEMTAIQSHFAKPEVLEKRQTLGLGAPTDVELEILAQTWSEHCKHKIFKARVSYSESSEGEPGASPSLIPAKIPQSPEWIDGLFKTTILQPTHQLNAPWVLSAFHDNAGIVAFDEEDAFCIKVETHNSPSALDPYGGALTGIGGVNRDILGCGLGARPIFNTDVFCVAPLDWSETLPDRLMHPRRILEGVRRGVEHGGNQSGIPTLNGALVFDERYLGKPLVYCGTGGWLPRVIAGRRCETKEVQSGDRVFMIGGRIGKDGIHGATFSSLALDESFSASVVQLGDPITQKRMSDFLLEARDLGLYRAVTDNGAGGLSSSVGEMALLAKGATIDVALASTKYPGLKPFELVISESQERMTVAVDPAKKEEFMALAERRGVDACDLGEFLSSGRFDVHYEGELVASLDLDFLHEGVPRLELQAQWQPPRAQIGQDRFAFERDAPRILTQLLGRPNIASKEWLVRQYDHEVQAMSVIKPFQQAMQNFGGVSSPNDAGVIKPKWTSDAGLAIGCGINPKLSDWDPYLMAQSAVDEAVRNLLCVGADFGRQQSQIALVDNFCWPDPTQDPKKMGALVRACFGLKEAALELSAPIVSGKDSMKNDFRGKRSGRAVEISVPPTLLMTAVGKITNVKQCRTAEFKASGDHVYLLGGEGLGLLGSEFMLDQKALPEPRAGGAHRLGMPQWDTARKIYRWLGFSYGKEQGRLRSLHDVSEGGVLVAAVESLFTRSLGLEVELKMEMAEAWETLFGEGFHSFIASCQETDGSFLEQEWKTFGIPFIRLGTVTPSERLSVKLLEPTTGMGANWSVPLAELRAAWQKEGYWS